MTRSLTDPDSVLPNVAAASAPSEAAQHSRALTVVPADPGQVALPDPGHIASSGRCFPSGLYGEPVAGDFFDVIALDDVRTLIAVGDVVGHGLAAVERMTALREETRALALRAPSVADVLRCLDEAQCGRGPEELATMWLAIYDRNTKYIRYASAGHPAPVLADVSCGARLLLAASAPPLGSGEVDKHVTITRVPLTPGALLVAYSDGLIERAGLDLEHQMEMLRCIVGQLYEPHMSQHALDRLVEGILCRLPHSPVGAPDDACVLAVHRPQRDRRARQGSNLRPIA